MKIQKRSAKRLFRISFLNLNYQERTMQKINANEKGIFNCHQDKTTSISVITDSLKNDYCSITG